MYIRLYISINAFLGAQVRANVDISHEIHPRVRMCPISIWRQVRKACLVRMALAWFGHRKEHCELAI